MGDGELPNGYFETYTSNHGIWKEHRLDATAILRTLQGLPDFWAHLCELAATDRILSSVDAGAGEAAKSLAVLVGLFEALEPLGLERLSCTPTSRMTTNSRSRPSGWLRCPLAFRGR